MNARIRIGTASWTDPGFVQDWYPSGLPKNQLLSWYAQHFDFVEVNSSFYSIPNARVVEAWCRQTPDDFVFDIKLFKLLSRHSTETKFLPPDLRVKASPRSASRIESRFGTGGSRTVPERSATAQTGGQARCFPPAALAGFSSEKRTIWLSWSALFGVFREQKLAVELRNRDWMSPEEMPGTVEFFTQRGISLVGVDAPESEHFTVMPFSDVVTNPALASWRSMGATKMRS